jgi:bifunctional DNA-binding transcriptional regulator/antitoxin component of YhaV-PrlF toxin-antitoxin module
VPLGLLLSFTENAHFGRASAHFLYVCTDRAKRPSRVSSKNQVTLPVGAMRATGLSPGDVVSVRPNGDGEIVIALRGSRVRRHAGIASGIYEAGELDRLRDEWQR